MASINGVQLKNLKSYRGHEGEPCAEGTVYIDGVKVGLWNQDTWGGPDMFNFPTGTLKERAKRCKSVLIGLAEVFMNEDIFMMYLSIITKMEKSYKGLVKNGVKRATSCVLLDVGIYSMQEVRGTKESAMNDTFQKLYEGIKQEMKLSDEQMIAENMLRIDINGLGDFDLILM